MSLKSWKKEYYPKDAADVAETADKRAKARSVKWMIPLVEHGLKKWRGLRGKAIAEHDGKLDHRRLEFDDGIFMVEGWSCALCETFGDGTCATAVIDRGKAIVLVCPLMTVRDDTRCDRPTFGDVESPWSQFALHDDPEPMIKLLERALRNLKRKVKKGK